MRILNKVQKCILDSLGAGISFNQNLEKRMTKRASYRCSIEGLLIRHGYFW